MRGRERQGEGAVPIYGEAEIGEAICGIAGRLKQELAAGERPLFVGIQKRGVPLAERVMAEMGWSGETEVGAIDIGLYRDDLDRIDQLPTIHGTELGEGIEGREILLFDDVLYTGRTVRAALGALLDYGRPARIRLVVLVDRGHRELPIQADQVGLRVEVGAGEHLAVCLHESDGRDAVYLYREGGGES